MTSYEFEVAAKNAVIKIIKEKFSTYLQICRAEVIDSVETLWTKLSSFNHNCVEDAKMEEKSLEFTIFLTLFE